MFSAKCPAALLLAGLALAARARGDEPPATSVASIQAKHDRALIRELTDYLRNSPKADDRDQAYAALFNKAIEHDWFTEAEELGQQYLKSRPRRAGEGPRTDHPDDGPRPGRPV